LFLVSTEDLASQVDQPNMPGTSAHGPEDHPNWSLSLPNGVEDFFLNPEVARGVDVVVKARGRA
jgi:hypothetical protein